MARVTLRKVTEALRERFGGTIELVRGKGYFYVSGTTDLYGDTSGWCSTGIYLYRLNFQPIANWVTDVQFLASEAAEMGRIPTAPSQTHCHLCGDLIKLPEEEIAFTANRTNPATWCPELVEVSMTDADAQPTHRKCMERCQ